MSQTPPIIFCYAHDNSWEAVFLKITEKLGINGNKSVVWNNGVTSIDEKIEHLVVPLFELKNNSIIPTGLDIVKDLRLQDHSNFSTIFVVTSEHNIPDIFNPHKAMYYEPINVIKNPGFNDIHKAVLLAELIFKKNDDRCEIKNILNINDDMFIDKFEHLIKNKNPHKITFREEYYRIFVNYYDSFRIQPDLEKITIEKFLGYVKTKYKETGETVDESQNSLNELATLAHHLDFANEIYNFLNGIRTAKKTHRVKYELFRAPMPFPLQELVDAKRKIEKDLKQENTKRRIKLLLIDNKIDKIKTGNQKGPLLETFKNFDLQSIFEIEMLGDIVYKSDDTGQPQFYKREFDNGLLKEREFDIKKLPDKSEEIFDYKEFKEQLQLYLEEDATKISKYTYPLKVYEKIKSSHFILLDFFLNEENTYLASDFIKDISKIKKQEGDYSTTWYFITSAVYDSVVKYSQSGLLAEYYESAVVNAGDDPTNKKRQIIFVYKLLTFIQSRLRSFNSYKNAIYNYMLNDAKEIGKEVCCVTAPNKNIKTAGCLENCRRDNCLEEMQTYIKRYLTEYDNIWSLFYDEKHKKDYKNIAVLLDDTIKKFLWLPEAEWQMVQHQIDYINAKLKTLGENGKFSCQYINGELEKRSEIY